MTARNANSWNGLAAEPEFFSFRGALLLLVLSFGFMGSLETEAADASSPCKKTAKDTLKSCKSEVISDFWLAVARCDNLSSAEGRQACKNSAAASKQEGMDECREQAEARQDLCGELGPDVYRPQINPSDFVSGIDNPLFPVIPGTTLVYEGPSGDGAEHIEVAATGETVTILGVQCAVVRDTVTVGGEVVEDTRDYYAQDLLGNVWYFGEVSVEYEDGRPVSVEGSWRAGLDDAQPGIIMEANPAAGDLYRQEYAIGEAEDIGEVIAVNQSVTVPFGTYTGCLVTADTSPMEPDAVEHKYYAPGVGLVRELDPETGHTIDLIEIRTNAHLPPLSVCRECASRPPQAGSEPPCSL